MAATTEGLFKQEARMPRPWAVEDSRSKLNSSKREAPWGKPMASGNFVFDSI